MYPSYYLTAARWGCQWRLTLRTSSLAEVMTAWSGRSFLTSSTFKAAQAHGWRHQRRRCAASSSLVLTSALPKHSLVLSFGPSAYLSGVRGAIGPPWRQSEGTVSPVVLCSGCGVTCHAAVPGECRMQQRMTLCMTACRQRLASGVHLHGGLVVEFALLVQVPASWCQAALLISRQAPCTNRANTIQGSIS